MCAWDMSDGLDPFFFFNISICTFLFWSEQESKREMWQVGCCMKELELQRFKVLQGPQNLQR